MENKKIKKNIDFNKISKNNTNLKKLRPLNAKNKISNKKARLDSNNLIEKTYIIENIDCGSCAAKIERRINNLSEVQYATFTFATKKLKVQAENPDNLLPTFIKIATTVEPDAKIYSQDDLKKEEIKKSDESQKLDLSKIGKFLGALLYLTALILNITSFDKFSLGLFIISYILLGGEVLITAFRNILKGQIFDENFLMSIATLGAFAISEYPEAVGVMLFYQIGEFLEEKAISKSRKQIASISQLKTETAILISEINGEIIEKNIKIEDVKIDDILLIKPGMRIPVDGVLLDKQANVDKSSITGEHLPEYIEKGESLISGSINLDTPIKMKVEKPLLESMITTIINSIDEAVESKPKMERFITKFASIYTPIVVLIAVLTSLLGGYLTQDWYKWFYIALTFLVISCPCALVLSIPMTYFAGIGAVAKQGILFKGGIVLERLKNIKHIVFDKTGTLTKGNFSVEKIIYTENASEDTNEMENNILSLAYICEKHSTHPIAKSIVETCKKRIGNLQPLDDLYFNITEIKGQGIIAKSRNEEIICGNAKIMESNNISIEKTLLDEQNSFVLVAKNHKIIGSIVISDELKDDSLETITQLVSRGYKVSMLTGDNKNIAENMAQKLGLTDVFAGVLPHEKLKTVQDLRSTNNGVLFVGDGINDAPVLAGADVGVAMGSGTDVAIESADIVLLNSNPKAVLRILEIAKKSNSIAFANISFAIGIKIAVLVLGLLGVASMWMAVFADSGVTVLCLLNSLRLFKQK